MSRTLRCICVLAIAALPQASAASRGAAVAPRASAAPLDLEPFEDDDCLEARHADVLFDLLYEMCDILEQVLYTPPDDRLALWPAFDTWVEANMEAMQRVAHSVLGRPYCEPGKVAWMAAECLLLLRTGEDGFGQALECAEALDEDFLASMTPRGSKFETRLHLVLRSPWPAFRLLDLLVRLHPQTNSTRMGACKSFRNWRDDPDQFDWPWFKPRLLGVVDAATADPTVFDLLQADGPLSRQYRARWLRLHDRLPDFMDAMGFADDVFDAYRDHHYKAGCHLGVISCYAMQIMLIHLRDVEGRLHRYTASVAQLINLHGQLTHMARTDWPVFRLLHMVSLLQRVPTGEVWKGASRDEPRAPREAAVSLCAKVEKAAGGGGISRVYVTGSWGHLSRFAGKVLMRWASILQPGAVVAFLALDEEAARQCKKVRSKAVRCIDAPRRLGVDAFVAKYLALASVTRLGLTAVWFDLDVYPARDPEEHVRAALAQGADIAFAKHLASETLFPAVVAARGSEAATDMLMRYAKWLRENPFLLDHQGWDQFFHHKRGDFAGGFDYKGRNVTRVENDTGPDHSFLPPDGGLAPPETEFGTFGQEFGSGDGWLGHASGKDLALFHFWGCEETQERLFELLYPGDRPGFPERALETLARYRRVKTAGPGIAAMIGKGGRQGGGGKPLHLVGISYADGCCEQSLEKNRRQALKVGLDEARAYKRGDLGPAWAARNAETLSQRRGGGWWLWKPYLILKTLRDPAVPWNRGVAIWVDAGNFLHADPRELVSSALRASDVTALRLKWCLEAEWTSRASLQALGVADSYAVVDRPQLGAYFLVFRKTQVSIDFVEEWLRLSEDPAALLEGAVEDDHKVPSFQKHQADQSIFSVLFKQRGFHALTLEEGHKVVTLARWRE